MPVGGHVLVTLTVLGALLTSVVAVGLMNPGLVPWMAGDQHAADATSESPAALSESPQQPAPEIVTIVITPDPSTPSSSGAPPAAVVDGQPSPPIQPSTTSQPATAQPVRTQAVPTPNPDFTPAVQQRPASGGYEENEHEGYDDDEGYEDDEHDEREDD